MTPDRPIGIGLMCKPPRPGISKTRLAASIGAMEAAKLSEAFLRDVAEAIERASGRTPLHYRAFYRPISAEAELHAILGDKWAFCPADAGDLGSTMMTVFQHLLAECPDGALIIGADVPLISADHIVAATTALRRSSDREVVVAPTTDGGYCLIGTKSISAASHLFANMIWSASDVFDQTLQRASRAGLAVTKIDQQRDIDDASDLSWLCRIIDDYPHVARATSKAIKSFLQHSPPQHK